MKIFALYVYCRRNGISCDSGEQCRCEAETKEEAQIKLNISTEISWLHRFYDEVYWEIREVV